MNILSYQQTKKKKTQIYEVLKFSSMSFYILKLLQDSLLLIIESSICVQNTLERLDPQFTNYQFKLNVKQLICGIWI